MATNIFNNTNPYQTQQTEQPQPDGSGGYTYQGKSYGAGTGPFASQFPVKKAQSKAQPPVKTTSNAQNNGSGVSGTQTGSQTGSTTGTGSSTTTTPTGLAWNPIYGAMGFTQDMWDNASPTQQMLWEVSHNAQLAAYGQSATSKPVETYINQATNDPTLLATYGDALNLDTQTLQQGIQNIQTQLNVTAQTQQAQMQQAQAGLEKTFGASGTAYSSFREGAQQQLNTQNQGIITSTAQQIQNQLNQAASGYTGTYGSTAAQGQNLSATYLNPLTGQNQTLQGQVLGGITGTQPLAKQQAIDTEAANSITLDQPATTYKLTQ